MNGIKLKEKKKQTQSGLEKILLESKVHQEIIESIKMQQEQIRLALLEPMRRIQERLIQPLIIFQEQIKLISEKAREFKKLHEKVKKSRNKWILYKELPISTISLYDPNTHTFINFLEKKEDAEELARFYKGNKYFKPHISVLREAFIAHASKNYIVSIPLLLTQIDGIIIRYGKSRGLVKNKKIVRTNMIAHMRNLIKVYQLISKEFIEFVDKKVKTKRAKENQLWEFRNSVLHGIDPNYADEQWSIKLLYVLIILECALK